MKIIQFSSCVFAAFLVASCSESSSSKEGSAGTIGAPCPTESALTYENFGKGFMTNYCVSCHSSTLSGAARHGAPSDHDFDSLAGIRAVPAEHIDEEAAAGPDYTHTAMPPGDPRPSLEERKNLGEWLACGTP